MSLFSSDILFRSAGSIIRTGRVRPLTPADAPPLPSDIDPAYAPEAFATLPTAVPRQFITGVFFATGAPARRIMLLTVIKIAIAITTPILLHRLLSLLPSVAGVVDVPINAFVTAAALGTMGLVGAIVQQHWYFNALRGFAIITNGLNNRVIRHALRLRRSARTGMQTGDMVNHLSSDTEAMSEAMFFIPEFLNTTLQCVAVIATLWWFLGPATLAALATLAAVSPLTVAVARRYRRLDHTLMELRDERVTLMSQILQGIRVVKYHAWEHSVGGEVERVRSSEVDTKVRIVRTDAMSTVLFISTTTLVAFAGFGTYVLLGGALTAPLVFACIALFAMLEEPFGLVSHLLANAQHARVAAGRLHRYFSAPTRSADERPSTAPGEAVAIRCAELSMRYPDGEQDALQNITLEIPAGSSVAIIGTVGSGKSTLLRTLAGLHVPRSGVVEHPGLDAARRARTGYVPQEAFILNASVQENIIFGDVLREEDLRAVLRTCALEEDLAAMPAGLATEIGERGVNLSGGQKQRMALARAAYHRPGIVFLDDPLSAVDVSTEDVLADRLLFGAWNNVTRVVVTHRLAHLHRFDAIILLEHGRVVACGSFADVMRNEAVRGLVDAAMSEHPTVEVSQAADVPAPSSIHVVDAEDPALSSRLTEDEDRAVGAVGSSVYRYYLRAMIGHRRVLSPLLLLALIGSAAGITVLPIIQTSWLGRWTDGHRVEPSGVVDPLTAVLIYGALGLVVLSGWFTERVLWLERAAIAARRIHDSALRGVLAAPLRFFDSTPMGRILNRFARDMEAVDDHLSWNIEQSFKSLAQTIGSLILIVTVLPIVLLVVVPVLVLYYRLQRDYRASAREAKRLESIARSPRYAHFKELVTGLDVIHGFGRDGYMHDTAIAILRGYQRQFWCSIMLNRWFSTRVPLISGLIGLATSLVIVWFAWRADLTPGTAGIVLTYALSFWMSLNWTVRAFSEVESRMTSVERLRHYASLDPEPPTTSGMPLSDTETWPVKGAITIRDLSVRYAAHLPLVLHNVSMSVEPAMKVGIIGRTGSGKSTLFQSLFRFVEPTSGIIAIDGVDITRVPLARLRRSVAIIPQDPTLFIGSVRSNLDRFATAMDAEVWEALRRVRMDHHVRSLPGGLHAAVVEGGANFSQGQRQLLCLARAILTRARVIVLDEATASVDLHTDALVQRTIREEFRDVTVLVIAHRLDTVADADMIVELAAGRVVKITTR